MTTVSKSLTYLRKQGFIADVVERWLPVPGKSIRKDLFGIADVIGANPRTGQILLVQVTTIGHVAHRLAKAKEKPELVAWLRAGGTFVVHGWCQRNGKWLVKIVAVNLDDMGGLSPVVLTKPPRKKRQSHYQGELFS